MGRDLISLGYGNIPLLELPEEASGNSRLGQTYAPHRWNFLGPEPSLYYRRERVESEAEIRRSALLKRAISRRGN